MLNLINTIDLTIWEREFSLEIDYDCFEDEVPSQEQMNSLNEFLANPDWIEESKEYIEEFCKEKVYEDAENTKKDNIFSYIKPDYIFVKAEKNNPRIALMCKYRYDKEHGLAVVFTTTGDITVGIQDIIL